MENDKPKINIFFSLKFRRNLGHNVRGICATQFDGAFVHSVKMLSEIR